MANADDDDILDAGLFVNTGYTLHDFCIQDFAFKLKVLDAATTDYDLTGQVIWPAAKLMCHYILANRQIFNDKKVLEVGSGTGMSGIVAGHFAKSMVLTDHNEIVLNLLKENAEINEAAAAHTTCQLLDWGNDSHLEKLGQHQYDIVIGSDVIYWYNCLVPLLKSVDYLLSRNTGAQFIMAYKSRALNAENYFFSQAADTFHFTYEQVPKPSYVAGEDIDSFQDVHVYILRRK